MKLPIDTPVSNSLAWLRAITKAVARFLLVALIALIAISATTGEASAAPSPQSVQGAYNFHHPDITPPSYDGCGPGASLNPKGSPLCLPTLRPPAADNWPEVVGFGLLGFGFIVVEALVIG